MATKNKESASAEPGITESEAAPAAIPAEASAPAAPAPAPASDIPPTPQRGPAPLEASAPVALEEWCGVAAGSRFATINGLETFRRVQMEKSRKRDPSAMTRGTPKAFEEAYLAWSKTPL